jgi:hypothetical protein
MKRARAARLAAPRFDPRRIGAAGCLTLAAVTMRSQIARADPIRLRADGYAQAKPPLGLLVLQGEDRTRPWLDAEGLAWMGARPDATNTSSATGDVLTLTVRLRDPAGRGEVRVGRFLASMGAVRPLHLDGATAIARAPFGTSVEAFGGAPVVARFGDRTYDWAVGGRVAQSVARRATLGVAYLHRRDRGRLADEEIGGDFASAPFPWLDLAARSAFDLMSSGPSDALGSAALRAGDWRFEAFGTYRSPARLLPATSLFSVLGDVPATRAGGTVTWRAAPRLDVLATGAGQIQAGRVGAEGTLRGTLRTDDDGLGYVGLELRRRDFPDASWSGVRAVAAAPVWRRAVRTSMEFEIVRPDDPRGRGDVWPWGLLAVSWRAPYGFEVASAAEAAATPTNRREITVLGRISWAWGAP